MKAKKTLKKKLTVQLVESIRTVLAKFDQSSAKKFSKPLKSAATAVAKKFIKEMKKRSHPATSREKKQPLRKNFKKSPVRKKVVK